MRSIVSAILISACMALTGCAGGRSHDILSDVGVVTGEAASNPIRRIHVATTRSESDRAAEVFGRGRSQYLGFAYVDVAVPPGHRLGDLSRPKSGKADPKEHFIATKVGVHDSEQAFAEAIRADLKRTGGHALVFVHGYKNHFDSSVYRLTQLVEDAKFAGTPVLFSWASSGKLLGYVYDRDSVNAAREELEETMRILVENGARRIDLVAHSMGCASSPSPATRTSGAGLAT